MPANVFWIITEDDRSVRPRWDIQLLPLRGLDVSRDSVMPDQGARD